MQALNSVLSSLLWDSASRKIQLSYKLYLHCVSLVYKHTLVSTIFKIINKQKHPTKLYCFPWISLLWCHSVSSLSFTDQPLHRVLCSHPSFPFPSPPLSGFFPYHLPEVASHLPLAKSSDLIPNVLSLSVTFNTDYHTFFCMGFPGGSYGKASVCNAGDPGSIAGSGRSPGEGNGNPLQYSCLESHGQRSVVDYSLWGLKESDTTERLYLLYFTTTSALELLPPVGSVTPAFLGFLSCIWSCRLSFFWEFLFLRPSLTWGCDTQSCFWSPHFP